MTPTQRSLAQLRKRGYTAAVVEHWNGYARIRQDLFGFGDVLGAGKDILLVQTTTAPNAAARRKKIEGIEAALTWLQAGGCIEVHGWKKVKGRWMVSVWNAMTLRKLDGRQVIEWGEYGSLW